MTAIVEYTAATQYTITRDGDGMLVIHLSDEHGDRVSPNHRRHFRDIVAAHRHASVWLADPTDEYVAASDRGER